MKLVMAISADGYLAREKNDRMRWLGKPDKAVFRILTGADGVDCLLSNKTYQAMPSHLEGRTMHIVSRNSLTLEDAHKRFPNGWLIGGPTLAKAALDAGYVSEVHLCRSDRYAFPEPMVTGPIHDWLSKYLLEADDFRPIMHTKVLDVTVELWRHQYV